MLRNTDTLRRWGQRLGRLALAGLTASLLFTLAGDRNVRSATSSGQDPLDLLDLQVKPNLLILMDTSGSMKFGTASVPGFEYTALGGDDPFGRLYQIKSAVDEVVDANEERINFGMFTFANRSRHKPLNQSEGWNASGSAVNNNQNDGPFFYVSRDAGADLFYFRNADGDGTLYESGGYNGTTGGGDAFYCESYLDSRGRIRPASAFFCDNRNGNDDYDSNPGATNDPTDTQSREVFQSFGNLGALSLPYPEDGTWNQTEALTMPGTTTARCPTGTASGQWNCARRKPICTPGTDCRYYLSSRVYRTGRQYTWDRSENTFAARLTRVADYTCPKPPADLVGFTVDADKDGTADNSVPCFQFVDADTSATATFYYTSSTFQVTTGTDPVTGDDIPGSCDGSATMSNVVSCDTATPTVIGDTLRAELPLTSSGALPDLTANPADAPSLFGVDVGVSDDEADPGLGDVGARAAGATPIGTTLRGVREETTDPAFPPEAADLPAGARQRNFVLVLTDGDDTCADIANRTGPQAAAQRANELYYNGGFNPRTQSGTAFRNQAETIVVAFTNSVGVTAANNIAKAGSGGVSADNFATVTCPANGAPCRNALVATTLSELRAQLKKAMEFVTTAGHFADRTLTASVFEFGTDIDVDPEDAGGRYNSEVAVLFQSSWMLPGFQGKLAAYTADPDTGAAVLRWEAGQKLLDGVGGATTLVGAPLGTFEDLHDNATEDGIGTSGALIKRRIFTTTSNGVNDSFTPQNLVASASSLRWNRVSLWPPDPASVGTGELDDEMGIENDFVTLRDTYGACRGTNAPAECASSDVSTAKREAREIILANMVGASLARDGAGLPLRVALGGDKGKLLYVKKDWVLADATMGTPAVIRPPVDPSHPSGAVLPVALHQEEYKLFTDGPRSSGGAAVDGTDAGFGLTNPDRADAGIPSAALSPRMTVVLHPANDMLHAFRAGPGGSETGGEELWGFVPYDQLSKLRERLLRPQTRDEHTYMMAASVRFAYLWVPGNFTSSIQGAETGAGVWRIIAYVGRGPGGKFLTALDVTTTKAYTTPALDTTPPIVVWSRGNDGVEFDKLGETWAVPAVVPVDSGVWDREYILLTGSGYSDDPDEGKTLYVLDPLTGDVLQAFDITDGSSSVANAIVAGPTGFQPGLLLAKAQGNEASEKATLVFFGDVHGRVFKYDLATPATAPAIFSDRGAGNPIGVSLANLNGRTAVSPRAFVYGETGADSRVEPTTPVFEMFGLGDNGASAPDTFIDESFPTGFRGTIQPSLVFLTSAQPEGADNTIVMYVGTRFTEATTQCVSEFASVLYLLQGANGKAAFDLPGTTNDKGLLFEDQKITSAQFTTSNIQLGMGLGADTPPPPPARLGGEPTGGGRAAFGLPPNPNGAPYEPLPGTSVFKIGSSVCR